MEHNACPSYEHPQEASAKILVFNTLEDSPLLSEEDVNETREG